MNSASKPSFALLDVLFSHPRKLERKTMCFTENSSFPFRGPIESKPRSNVEDFLPVSEVMADAVATFISAICISGFGFSQKSWISDCCFARGWATQRWWAMRAIESITNGRTIWTFGAISGHLPFKERSCMMSNGFTRLADTGRSRSRHWLIA